MKCSRRVALSRACLFVAACLVLTLVPVSLVRAQATEDTLDRAERGRGTDTLQVGRQGSALGTFGVGAILGSPTGLSAKLMFLGGNAFQIHLGYGFGRRGHFVLIGDYLFHFFGVLPRLGEAGSLAPYAGIGGRLGVREEDPVFGVRVPVGLSLAVSGAPIEVFLELGVGIGLVPETDALVDGGLGGRWYF